MMTLNTPMYGIVRVKRTEKSTLGGPYHNPYLGDSKARTNFKRVLNQLILSCLKVHNQYSITLFHSIEIRKSQPHPCTG